MGVIKGRRKTLRKIRWLWEDDIKIYIRIITWEIFGYVPVLWIHLFDEHLVSIRAGTFLNVWVTVNLPWRTCRMIVISELLLFFYQMLNQTLFNLFFFKTSGPPYSWRNINLIVTLNYTMCVWMYQCNRCMMNLIQSLPPNRSTLITS